MENATSLSLRVHLFVILWSKVRVISSDRYYIGDVRSKFLLIAELLEHPRPVANLGELSFFFLSLFRISICMFYSGPYI